MRILLSLIAVSLLTAPLTPRAHAAEPVSVEVFYDTLDPYGDWIQSADYGYVWHPRDAGEDWRPYTVGGWAYTDAGWTWVSTEPFGGIVYHYGRWTRLRDTGWVWVPDVEWSPAWVSFRRSDQYIGWAPLPPEATFRREVGISSWCDSYYDIGPTQYSFVAARDFGRPELQTVVLPRRQNVGIIADTRNITNITYTERGIYNDGPQYDVVVRESREPVRRLRLERRDDVVYEGRRVGGDGLKAAIVGDALRVFAPSVGFRPEVAPPRVARRVDRVEVDRGWRDVPQSQDLRGRISRDTPRAPAALPAQPAFTRAAAALGLGAPAERTGDRGNATRSPAENRPTREGVAGERARMPGNADAAPAAAATQKLLREADEAARPGSGTSNRKSGVGGQPEGRPANAERGDRPPTGRMPQEPGEVRSNAAPGGSASVPPRSVIRPDSEVRREAVPEAQPGKDRAARPDAASDTVGKPRVTPDEERAAKDARSKPDPSKVKELKIPSSGPGAEGARVRKEGGPETPRKPESAPVARPGTTTPPTTGAPAARGKKGPPEATKEGDKEKP